VEPTPPERLRAAVDSLYLTFARYPYRASMPACAHCVTDADLIALGASSVRDLPADLLARYARKAVSTWGDIDDFKRLTPRLLDLVSRDQPGIPPMVITTKLRRANWATWPTEERKSIWQFLAAWWRFNLTRWAGPGRTAFRVLDTIAVAETDLDPYFSEWHHALAGDTDGRLPAIRHLVELLCESPLQVDDPDTVARLAPEATGDADKQYQAFLLDPATDEELERALADYANTEHARRMAVAFARLRRYGNAVTRAAT
jgi:hypothetical protein